MNSALSMPEILVHGLADGTATMFLLVALAEGLDGGDLALVLTQLSLGLVVLLLSALVFARRIKPQSRRLRVAEILLSVLVAAAGAAATLSMLALMASGATYRGDSPDAAGMGIAFGLFLYFPSAGLLILPLAMKVSRLSPRLRRGLGWSVFLLVLLPFAVLAAVSLSAG